MSILFFLLSFVLKYEVTKTIISTILGASSPQSVDVKEGAADAQVVLRPNFFYQFANLC